MAKSRAQNSKQKNSSRGAESDSKDLQNLERIFELMEKHEITEFEWERQGERFKFKTSQSSSEISLAGLTASAMAHPSHLSAPRAAPQPATLPQKSEEKTKPADAHPNRKQVLSPFVGTFYRAASPEAEPYVREGQGIKRGEVLCIVEAMKLMNEIEAEFPGKIVSVLAENGQAVEFGEPLFIVEP